jgi:hypothetical protein
LLRGIGRLLVAAGRGVGGFGRVAAAAWRTLLVVGRGIAWVPRYAARALRAAGLGIGRVWRAAYGPELVQVGVTSPFRWLRRVLRPFSAAVGDLKRRSTVLMRRQWRALRGSS